MTIGLYAAHRRSSAAAQRQSLQLGLLIGLLMVFAVGVDMLHIVIKSLTGNRPLDIALIATEAAGETAVMAALAAYALHLVRQPVDRRVGGRPPEPPHISVPPLLRGLGATRLSVVNPPEQDSRRLPAGHVG